MERVYYVRGACQVTVSVVSRQFYLLLHRLQLVGLRTLPHFRRELATHMHATYL